MKEDITRTERFTGYILAILSIAVMFSASAFLSQIRSGLAGGMLAHFWQSDIPRVSLLEWTSSALLDPGASLCVSAVLTAIMLTFCAVPSLSKHNLKSIAIALLIWIVLVVLPMCRFLRIYYTSLDPRWL